MFFVEIGENLNHILAQTVNYLNSTLTEFCRQIPTGKHCGDLL